MSPKFPVTLPVVKWITGSPGMPLTWVESRVMGIPSDSDDHSNSDPVSLDPQWYIKDNRSSPSMVKLIGQKHGCPSMTPSG